MWRRNLETAPCISPLKPVDGIPPWSSKWVSKELAESCSSSTAGARLPPVLFLQPAVPMPTSPKPTRTDVRQPPVTGHVTENMRAVSAGGRIVSTKIAIEKLLKIRGKWGVGKLASAENAKIPSHSSGKREIMRELPIVR
nr:hypothetical protein BgiMline_030609 [Biomphalaria glabrata]